MDLFKGLSGKFLIPYALTAVFGIWTYFTIDNIRQYQSVKDSLQVFQIKLLEMRKHEKDFMAREHRNVDFLVKGESTYKTKFNVLSNELDSIAGVLSEGEAISRTSRDSINFLLHEYTSTFNNLTELIQVKGFKDWGLIGELRKKIHAVEDDQTRYDRAFMLMLRRHEKDFFLRNDEKYLDKFEGGVEDFNNHLDQVVLNQRKREELTSKIDDYQAIFRRVVRISKAIGLNEEEGAHGKLRAAVHELTPFVKVLVTDVSEQMDRKVRQNVLVLILLFVGIVVIGVFILSWHIRKITRNINLIKEHTKMLAQGKFPDLQKIDSKDELGMAHESINRLIEGLMSKSKFAEKVGKGKLEANLDMLSEDDVLAKSLLEMRDNLKGAIEDTNEVVKRAGEEGYLEARIDITQKKGAWKELSDSINNLLFSVSTPLITLNRIFNEMAKGDLTLRYRSETKGDISTMTTNLNKALDNLQNLLLQLESTVNEVEVSTEEMLASSQEMNTSTAEIASAISEISSGAQNQVQRVDETSSLAERILKSSEDVGDHSLLINKAAKKGVEDSRRGAEMVSNVEMAMESISSYSKKSNESISVLTDRSNEISSVLRVINEISSQTNLLALNAAIEAAQAGDAGRGFAVVAEEIRKLAEETKTSAQEIENLVEGVVSDTQKAANNMKSMVDMIDSGDKITKQTSVVFQEIAVTTQQTLNLSEEILSSSKGQKQDIQDIVKNTEGIVVIAEETAAGTEESAASSTQLSAGMETYASKSTRLSQIAKELKSDLDSFCLKDDITPDVNNQSKDQSDIFHASVS